MKTTLAVAALIVAALGVGSATVDHQHSSASRHQISAAASPDDLGWGTGSTTALPA